MKYPVLLLERIRGANRASVLEKRLVCHQYAFGSARRARCVDHIGGLLRVDLHVERLGTRMTRKLTRVFDCQHAGHGTGKSPEMRGTRQYEWRARLGEHPGQAL